MGNDNVSIIICNYNKSKDLVERCLCSISKQTYKNIILYYVDNGSTKDTLSQEDINKWNQYFTIHSYFLDTNRGVAGGYNVALRDVETNLYTFVDSDDYVAPDYIEKMVNDYEINKCGLTFVRHSIVYPDNSLHEVKIYGSKKQLPSEEIVKSILDWNHGYSNGVSFEDMGTHWGILFARDKMKTKNFQRPENRYKIGIYEDFDYVISMVMQCKNVSVLDDCLYYLNRAEVSTSSGHNPEFQNEIFKATESIYCNIRRIDDYETIRAFGYFIWRRLEIFFWNCNDYNDFLTTYKEFVCAPFYSWFKKYKPDNLKQCLKFIIFNKYPRLFWTVKKVREKL